MPESRLPSGIVTFLFTDIEGSTRLWERYGSEMGTAVALHDGILRDAIAAHGGVVFKTVGDAFCAAFATVPDALAAVIEAQRTLAAEQWQETGPLRVRMAVHTGEAEERDDDYFGPAVNRVARLLSTGHGGQVLLSAAVVERLEHPLPGGASLRDLGERRLKDLIQPEQIHQLVVAGLPDAFPPLNSLDARPNNLPLQPSQLLGREAELAEAKAHLRAPATRLLTLTGAGGSGKTRLALQTAADLIDDFPHGVWFVDLSATTDPALVLAEAARAIGLREEGGETIEEQLRDHLREKEILLLLDNFEQLLPAAKTLAPLLGTCPKLKLLVTSRAPLRIAGEQEFPIPPLPVPDPRRLPDLAHLEAFPSVELFVARAAAVKPGFALNEDNARPVAQICTDLDGLPLAIELAAARVRMLSPQAMLPRLADRLKLLTGGQRDRPERQQTLRAAIAWSHDLLQPEERTLFARLAVFAGGCTLEAAEAVATAAGDLDVFEAVGRLVEHSLARQEEDGDGEPRFRMLATIREFAEERLVERGEAEAMRQTHAAHFLAFAEAAETQLAGPDQGKWLDRLEAEHDNFRATLAWSKSSGQPELGLRLAAALARFWGIRGHLSEGKGHLEQALAAATDASPVLRAEAMNAAGALTSARGEYEAAEQLHEEALALYRSVHDDGGIAHVLENLGFLAEMRGDFSRATSLYEEALVLNRTLGESGRLAESLYSLGAVALGQGVYGRAETLFEECLALCRTAGDERGVGIALNSLGAIALHQNDYDRAATLFEESLAAHRAAGDKQNVPDTVGNLAHARHRQGQLEEATELLDEAQRLYDELGDKGGMAFALAHLGRVVRDQNDLQRATDLMVSALLLAQELGEMTQIAECLDAIADIACARGEIDRAVRTCGAVESLRESIGVPRPPIHQADFDRVVETARSTLGEASFAAVWTEGRAIGVEEAISEATRVGGPHAGNSTAP
ncbi:MAG: ATP-binding protein [Thermomicrobiales bacterium]